jgi:hypothetical protein
MFHLFWTYVIANALRCKCFIGRSDSRAHERWFPRAHVQRTRVRTGSQAAVGVEHKIVSMGMTVGVEHEAVSMLGCSLSLFPPLFQIDAAGQQHHHVPTSTCGQQECTARHGPSLLLLMAAGAIISPHKHARSNQEPATEA